MLKQIGVRLEEELIKKVKQSALDNQISIQEVFTAALDCYFDNKLTSDNDNKLESEQVNKLTEPADVFFGDSVVEQLKGVHDPLVKSFLKEEPKPSDYYPNPLEQEYDYVLRKTAKVGKVERDMKQYQQGPIFWMIPFDCRPHFDADGNRIPFRYTDEHGKVVEPDEDEMNELREAYGSNIKVEE